MAMGVLYIFGFLLFLILKLAFFAAALSKIKVFKLLSLISKSLALNKIFISFLLLI